MINKPAVYIHMDEKEKGFLEYVSHILKKLNLKPLIVFSRDFLSDPLGYIAQRQEKKIYDEVNEFVKEYFDGFEIYVSFEPADKTVNRILSEYDVDMAFARYKRQLLGRSLSEKVIDNVRVWVYKDGCSPQIGTVCVPLDFSDRSVKQLEFLKYLKTHFPIEFRLLHALNTERLKDKLTFDEYLRLVKDRKDEAIHLFKETFGELELDILFLEGDPYRSLSEHINSERYSLTLMSKRGKGMAKIVGSVSRYLLRSIKCPMIVL